MANREVPVDQFSIALSELLSEVKTDVGAASDKAVTQSVRRTAKKLRGEYTNGIGKHPWSEKYRHGFTSHVDRRGLQTEGEVGNKGKPGLVHLLEKGHLTVNGERETGKFPHMKPAFEDMSEDFVNRIERLIVESLGS